jgi:hypothetical protein
LNSKSIKNGKICNFSKHTAKALEVIHEWIGKFANLRCTQQKHQKWDYLATSGNTQQKSIRSEIH